ncbi:telomerase reverse transcriptase-like, partial [Homarus americanus]
KLYLDHLLRKINIEDIRWTKMLRPKDSKLIIEKFFHWVVEKIILFVLKSCYYITEGQYPNYGFQVFYFKKNEWQRKKTVAMGSLSKKNVKIEPRESRYCFPKTPLIRFIPKGKGVRPLIAIGNGCLSNEELTRSRLLVEHLIRKRKYNTFSLSFADAWQSYVTKLEEISVSSPLYYVRTDIKGAFDSISHEKLLELLWEQIEELPQTLQFEQYMCEMGRNVRKKYIPLENKRENEEELMRRKGFSLLNRQLIINPRRIFYKIKDYVMNQFFREGKNYFSLICGLAQGGKLSFHLSDLYYSTMLETYFDDYSNETSMLVKKADDILFVSVLHKEAEKFLGRIQSGIPEFNCIINEAKTSHNWSDWNCLPYSEQSVKSTLKIIIVDIENNSNC